MLLLKLVNTFMELLLHIEYTTVYCWFC